jgi:predicted nucleotide-binding protein (sugar kinase/HSP70/actin superfamily)
METRVHNCSKFLGLPDMTRAVTPECPPILDIDIDVAKGKRELYQAIYSLGRRFTWNPLKVKTATEAAWQAYLDYRQRMSRQRLMPTQAMGEVSGSPPDKREEKEDTWGTVGLIGHPYLLYDEYVNHRLVSRLESMGLRVLTSEMVDEAELEAAVTKLVGESYWTYEQEVVGAGGYYLENEVDGVIGVIAFGCGPDSLMIDMVQRHAKKLRTTPFMTLTLDEHTAETGLVTRLEAFLDMLKRRKRTKVETCV